MVLLWLAGCGERAPEPWKVASVDTDGTVRLTSARGGTWLRLEGVRWPPEGHPVAPRSAEALTALAASGPVEVVFREGSMSGPGRLRVGERDLGEELLRSGLARATDDAPEGCLAAEREARAARTGGFGEEVDRATALWLRGKALRLNIGGGNGAAMRDLAWTVAADFERPTLAFFGFTPAPGFGEPACVDRFTEQVAPRVLAAAGPADLDRLFTSGATVVEVTPYGPFACRASTVDGDALVTVEGASTTRRTFDLLPELPGLAWRWTETVEGQSRSSHSGGWLGEGEVALAKVDPDRFLLGGVPGFTSLAACEQELRTVFPSGCSEP